MVERPTAVLARGARILVIGYRLAAMIFDRYLVVD
jgi:hypothetical protein